MITSELATGTLSAPRQRHCSLADAMEFSAGNVDRAEILAHLRAGGFCRVKAEWSLAAIERHLIGKRGRFNRARTRAIIFYAIQAVAALFVLITGIAAGGIWSIAFGAVSICLACYRFDKALDETFSDCVLSNRVTTAA